MLVEEWQHTDADKDERRPREIRNHRKDENWNFHRNTAAAKTQKPTQAILRWLLHHSMPADKVDDDQIATWSAHKVDLRLEQLRTSSTTASSSEQRLKMNIRSVILFLSSSLFVHASFAIFTLFQLLARRRRRAMEKIIPRWKRLENHKNLNGFVRHSTYTQNSRGAERSQAKINFRSRLEFLSRRNNLKRKSSVDCREIVGIATQSKRNKDEKGKIM